MKIEQRPKVELELVLTISEGEARALDALSGYNIDTFIKTFYEQLGKHYMTPHEQSLRKFLETIHKEVPQYLGRLDDAKKAFNS
jgi:hypothetical protein